ncbi:hypothetical protein F503_03278 [Ophiostoma piceae UAMH 11346]|uniref:Uncharacterized protein n=1 Tax=Ophiostoma piceae (strain UAMH 11346) TaxID=1262450 RepID=S3C4T0_OPHP1|nr:hypothetical protein F503_03278 [Ophiostoma piceae UAMH 11346]
MAPNKKKLLQQFINDIPDDKLTILPDSPQTIYKDVNLRLDMQGITTNDEWNLQIQANKKAKSTSIRQYAPDTVAGPVLVPQSAPWTAEEIRQAFRDTSSF